MTAALLPSAPVLTVAWLKANPDLAAIHGGRVGTQMYATFPAIRVQRIGGSPDETGVDSPLLQVECWGSDERSADLLARTLVAVLPTVRGAHAGGMIYTYSIESGPFWDTDDPTLSTNVRYILTLRFIVTA